MNCYCQERKGRRYFRMRVPKELHLYLPSEISYSIKGLDFETARFRCKLLANRLRGIFEQAKYGVISMGILNLELPYPPTIYKIKSCCECNGLHDRGCGQKSMLELIQCNEDKSARLDYEKRRKVITALL